jgi:hypothetical protein
MEGYSALCRKEPYGVINDNFVFLPVRKNYVDILENGINGETGLGFTTTRYREWMLKPNTITKEYFENYIELLKQNLKTMNVTNYLLFSI